VSVENYARLVSRLIVFHTQNTAFKHKIHNSFDDREALHTSVKLILESSLYRLCSRLCHALSIELSRATVFKEQLYLQVRYFLLTRLSAVDPLKLQ
jgi:hypothetical protein